MHKIRNICEKCKEYLLIYEEIILFVYYIC
jgi:hypothetical protein